MKYISILLLAGLAFDLSGCSILQPITDKIAPAVVVYCNTAYVARLTIRDGINAELEGTGHTVHVHCKGDPE